MKAPTYYEHAAREPAYDVVEFKPEEIEVREEFFDTVEDLMERVRELIRGLE